MPEGLKIPVHMSPDQRNNGDEDDDREKGAAHVDDISIIKQYNLMGYDEPMGAPIPYRNDYCSNNLIG